LTSVLFLKNVVFYTQSIDQVCKKHLKNGEKLALQAVSCNQSQKNAVFYMKASAFTMTAVILTAAEQDGRMDNRRGD